MAEVISADLLEVGDIFRATRGSLFPTAHGDAYRISSVRSLTTTAVYRVIEAQNLRTGLSSAINLQSGVTVARLERQPLADLEGYLRVMPDGEALHIVRAGGEFWT